MNTTEFKVDIRFLGLSLFLHLGLFGLLVLLAHKDLTTNVEPVEIVYENSQQTGRKQFVPQFQEQKIQKNKNQKAHFLSSQLQRFDKETIARNMGTPKNSASQTYAQQKPFQQESLSPTSSRFLPSPNSMSSVESRQSTINFIEPNISSGQFTFLNSDFSTYASFYNRITPLIMYQWGGNIQEIALFPHMREKLLTKDSWRTRVELILDQKGYYKNTIIVASSGSPELDQAVVNALKNATPFINPPTGMIDPDNKVRIDGEFVLYTERPRIAN